MRKSYLILILTVLLSLSACVSDKSAPKAETTPNIALTEQLAEGKEINTDSCSKCHSTSVYAKTGSKIQNLDSLEKRIQACNSKTGAGLEKEELEALTLFLNTSFYKFKK